jgi:glutathione S-transferase
MAIWVVAAATIISITIAWFVIESRRRRTHPVSGGLHTEITFPHTQEFELYGNPFSHCSRKTRIVFAELGIDYRHHDIDLIETGSYQTISPAYLKINPAGLVPCLVHRGHPIFESDEILAYAAAHAGPSAQRLVPEAEQARWDMMRWIDYASLSSDDPMGGRAARAGSCIPGLTMPLFMTMIAHVPLPRIFVGLLFHPDKKRPAFFGAARIFGLRRMLRLTPLRRTIRDSRDHMRTHLAALEAQLRQIGGPWLLGADYTLADVSWSCLLLRLAETAWLDYFLARQDLAEIAAYWRRLQARPSWQAAITARRHPNIERGAADLQQMIENDPWVREALQGED